MAKATKSGSPSGEEVGAKKGSVKAGTGIHISTFPVAKAPGNGSLSGEEAQRGAKISRGRTVGVGGWALKRRHWHPFVAFPIAKPQKAEAPTSSGMSGYTVGRTG